MKVMNSTHQLFNPAKAEIIANDMNQGDPDWKYVVNHDPRGTGYSFIEIFDEEGEFVSRL